MQLFGKGHTRCGMSSGSETTAYRRLFLAQVGHNSVFAYCAEWRSLSPNDLAKTVGAATRDLGDDSNGLCWPSVSSTIST